MHIKTYLYNLPVWLCCVAVCCQQVEWLRVCSEMPQKCRRTEHLNISCRHWTNGYVGVEALVIRYLFISFTVCGKMMQQTSIFILKQTVCRSGKQKIKIKKALYARCLVLTNKLCYYSAQTPALARHCLNIIQILTVHCHSYTVFLHLL